MDGVTQDGLPDAGSSRSEWGRGQGGQADRDGADLCRTDPLGDGGADRIAWLSRTIEVEIIPRLMLAHREVQAEPPSRPTVAAFRPGPEEVAEMTGIVLTGETAQSVAYVGMMRERGVTMESVHLELFAPVAKRLGSLWEEDLIDFTEVTVGLWRLQQVLREFSPDFRAESGKSATGRRALFGAIPGEQHTLGLLIVTEFFRTAGWDVWDEPLGSTSALTDVVAGEWFDLAGLSAGCDARIDVMSAAILALRRASSNPAISVIVGGPLFVRFPDLAQTVGADASASDAKQAVLHAEQLVARQGKRG